MIRCKFFHFLFHVFPLRAFQGIMIKAHFEKCPYCLKALIEKEDVQTFFGKEDAAGTGINLWPVVQAGICEVNGKRSHPRFLVSWKWALGAACLILAVSVGYWPIKKISNRAMTTEELQINYVNIEEKPALPFIYKSQDSDIYFVWVERTP